MSMACVCFFWVFSLDSELMSCYVFFLVDGFFFASWVDVGFVIVPQFGTKDFCDEGFFWAKAWDFGGLLSSWFFGDF